MLNLFRTKAKREDLKEMLDRLTVWWVQRWVAEGLLVLPAGRTIEDLSWDWIPAGVPWWNPEQEITGDVLAIQNKLRTRSEIRRERYGDDWRDVVRKLAEEDQFLRENGMDSVASVQPSSAPAGGQPTDPNSGEPAPPPDQTQPTDTNGEVVTNA